MPGSVVSLSGFVNDKTATRQNFAAVTTIEDLCNITPRAFAPRFGVLYRKLSELAVKTSHVKASLDSLSRHYAAGTFPPQILGSLKVPTVQVTKEFEGTSDRQERKTELDAIIFNARKLALEKSIEIKTEEYAYLQGLSHTDALKRDSRTARDEVHQSIGSSFATGVDKDGNTVYADLYTQEVNFMMANGLELCRKAIAIGLTKHQREMMSKMAKLKLKKDTDTDMRDMPVGDVAKQIELAVRNALAKERGSTKKSSGKNGESPAESERTQLTGHSPSQQKTEVIPLQQKTNESQGSRKRKREWEQETQEQVRRLEVSLSKRFNPRDCFTYPKEFFHSDPHTRRAFMLLHSSLDFVDSIPEYQADVFLGKGVALDLESRQQLSLNGKFVLHAQKDPTLVPQALSHLRRTIRIRWFFRDRPSRSIDYRQFHVKSDWEPPKASAQVEEAIRQVESSLLSQVGDLPSRSYLLNPETKNLCRNLRQKQYLVKITDKNLGLAVVSHDWYDEQCLKHLSQVDAYQAVNDPPMDELIEVFHDLLKDFTWPKEVNKYLCTTTADLPRFHVIPKVHKTPWASRPIVPSHSWITSRASEVVDFYLQKFTRQVPFILDSTKSFIEKLRKIRLTGKCTLVSGDVRAMYTNIPVTGAKQIVSEALKKVNSDGVPLQGLWALLFYVLDNNYFTYKGNAYKQLSGIAMGTACAPAVANIYAARFEEDFVNKWSNKGLVLYGRYIDDIFMVFQGDPLLLDECLVEHHIPGLEIEWKRSESSMTFLDVDVRINGDILDTTIFRKELNKYMYIPFSSGHPLSVKKALVKAEISRMNTICSTDEFRAECKKRFRLNLYRRGYPSTLLDRWFSEPVKRPTERKAFLMLPSAYNPVWEYIDMGKLENAWKKNTVKLQKHLPEELRDPRFIKCLKRGWNMYDIYNRENITVLRDEASLGD